MNNENHLSNTSNYHGISNHPWASLITQMAQKLFPSSSNLNLDFSVRRSWTTIEWMHFFVNGRNYRISDKLSDSIKKSFLLKNCNPDNIVTLLPNGIVVIILFGRLCIWRIHDVLPSPQLIEYRLPCPDQPRSLYLIEFFHR